MTLVGKIFTSGLLEDVGGRAKPGQGVEHRPSRMLYSRELWGKGDDRLFGLILFLLG